MTPKIWNKNGNLQILMDIKIFGEFLNYNAKIAQKSSEKVLYRHPDLFIHLN